jgi:DNA-directed RNA polymerase specialized sigma24 family protein
MAYTAIQENQNKDQRQDREMLLLELYQQAFPLAARYMSRMGGSFEEAKDIFQDALVIYYEQVIVADAAPRQNARAYLLGISKHLWNKRFKEKSRDTSLDVTEIVSVETDPEYQEVSASRLLKLLHTAGRKCMELLSAFYYEKLPMEDLAKRYGFSGPRSATVQKFKCLEKVKHTVKEKSLSYEDIME